MLIKLLIALAIIIAVIIGIRFYLKRRQAVFAKRARLNKDHARDTALWQMVGPYSWELQGTDLNGASYVFARLGATELIEGLYVAHYYESHLANPITDAWLTRTVIYTNHSNFVGDGSWIEQVQQAYIRQHSGMSYDSRPLSPEFTDPKKWKMLSFVELRREAGRAWCVSLPNNSQIILWVGTGYTPAVVGIEIETADHRVTSHPFERGQVVQELYGICRLLANNELPNYGVWQDTKVTMPVQGS